MYWQATGLEKPWVARFAMYVPLDHHKIDKYLGTLHPEDLINVLAHFYK
ncbi:hypothetical protein [Paenibacillus endophyticus]|nr:hypothetical protein [Paenibacillus endophyticus]